MDGLVYLDTNTVFSSSMNVVVGAPRANTSQPGVIEAGAVYLCPWKPIGSKCIPIEFDTKGE